MARAKAPSRPHSGVSVSRAASRGRRASERAWLHTYVWQWHNLGIAVVLISALLLLPTLLRGLAELRDATVRELGYGVFLVIGGMAAVGLLCVFGRFRLSGRGLRWAAGLSCFAIALWGVLGFLHPATGVGSVDLLDVGAGGRFGAWLIHGLPGLTIWPASWVAGCLVFWPRQSLAFVRSIPPGLMALWRLNLHGHAATMLRAAVAAFMVRDVTPEADVAELRVVDVDGGVEPEVEAHASVPRAKSISVAAPAAGALEEPQSKTSFANVHRPSPWELPPMMLLAPPDAERAAPDNSARSRLIVDTLASFGVDAHVVQVNQGPTVTQFGLEPGWEVKTRTLPEKDAHGKPVLDKDGNPRFRTEEVSRTRVRVNQITSLANDLALALAAPSIRIEAPVPGKPVVGIEVPNTNASVVSLRSVLETPAFEKIASRSKIALALGKGVSGEAVAADLGRMPHLLIAGATGAGKSVCINSIVACILAHATPDEVRFVMIDPKRVELSAFGHIPHLALSKVIVDVEEVVGTLGAVIREMEARYKRFENLGVRNLEAYNRHPKVAAKLPFWVVIIDELADLMMAVPYEVERQICRLAQLARATGIHLIIATQRPSVDVVTGLIKANFPTRIAFAVSSQVDSRTILDSVGAEKLLGRGDMLFLATDAAKPRRLQGVYVSDQEIERLVAFWTSERWEGVRPPTYDHLVEEAKAEQEREEQNDDPLFEKASELAQEHSRISVSMLQRRLRIGYPRAARLMDQLEEAGVVGAAEAGQSREVLPGHVDESGHKEFE